MDLGPRTRPSTPRQRLVIAAVTATIMIIAVAVSYLNTRPQSTGSLEPTPTPTPTPTPSPSMHLPTSSATPTPSSDLRQWRVNGFLDDLDLDVFARSDGQLYRIQTAQQLVTATKTPALQSSGALMFIVERDQVIVRGWGSPGDGFRVYDGKLAEDLPDRLKEPETILSGPPGRLWVTTYRDDDPITRLTDLQGRPVRATHGPSSYPADAFQSDGEHGLIMGSAGGYFAMTSDGPRRLTRGALLAVGPSHILTIDCDSTLHCSRYVVDRDTGHRRRIGPAAPTNMNESGTISHNGRLAALWRWTRSGPAELRILDLRTGNVLTRVADPNGTGDADSLLWLADGRLIGILGGRILVYNPSSGKISKPDLHLSDIQQLGLRSST